VTVQPGDGAIAIADEARVAQVARALVDNALRPNPDGVEVTLSVESAGGTATLVVADDGPAIDESATGRLFDRFYRGPGGGEGSGLGLAIAHELAKRMGGSLTLVQHEGVPGKAFRLALPGALQPAPTILSA
jgi:signal transduction histidine kinase